MWAKSQNSQAARPLKRSVPKAGTASSTTAALRPMVARLP